MGAAVAACKAAGPSTPPAVTDDIAEIEARLQVNEDELMAEGIMVAQAAPSAAGDENDYAPPISDQEPVPTAPEADEEREEPANASADSREVTRQVKRKRDSRSAYRQRWLGKRRLAKDDAEQCKRICDLAEATCALADRICELAERHPDELRYEQACERAEDQCELASEACTACVD
jgi:hypothetical protein